MTDRERAFVEAKWTPRPLETADEFEGRQKRMLELISPQWAEHMNLEYGYKPGDEFFASTQDDGSPTPGTENQKVRAYRPEDMSEDDAPLALVLLSFVHYLRKNTDFFSGPDLDCHFPDADSPEFYEVLAVEALQYTGE